MNYDLAGIKNSVEVASGTAGATAKVALAGLQRSAVTISNNGSVPIYIKFVTKGASAPTITAADWQFILYGPDDRTWGMGENIEIYVFCATSALYQVTAWSY